MCADCVNSFWKVCWRSIFVEQWANRFLANVNYAIARPSVVCRLSVTFVHSTYPVEIFGNFLRHLVHWQSVDIHWKFYGDRPRRTHPSGVLTQKGWRNIAMSDISNAITPKQCKIGGKLVLITNRKSYMSFRLVPKSVTLNDLERRNGPYFTLFYRIW